MQEYVIKYLGQQTAQMVAEVLNGADTADMPVRTMDKTGIYINSDTAAAFCTLEALS